VREHPDSPLSSPRLTDQPPHCDTGVPDLLISNKGQKSFFVAMLDRSGNAISSVSNVVSDAPGALATDSQSPPLFC
jgi:hypothetical protein